jgi:hypothetical protein
MRASRPIRQTRRLLPLRRKTDETSVLILPEQTDKMIRVRRAIREAFHDSKALTIKGRRAG